MKVARLVVTRFCKVISLSFSLEIPVLGDIDSMATDNPEHGRGQENSTSFGGHHPSDRTANENRKLVTQRVRG